MADITMCSNPVPWVFYIDIKIRKNWFSYWWKTRGSNALEIQIWIFCITIGMPWHYSVVRYYLRLYGGLNQLKLSNDSFTKKRFSLLIGKYKEGRFGIKPTCKNCDNCKCNKQ